MNRLATSFNAEDFEIVSVNFKETPKIIAFFKASASRFSGIN
ncbi:hypothetical protein [Thiomicrorhabdus sp. Milos-T2]